MADHNLPTTTNTYADFVTYLSARFQDLARGLDPATTTPTNLPTNSIRFSSATKKWEKWDGSAWADLSANYSININGSVGATTPSTGAFTTLSSNSTTALAAGTTIGGVAAVTISGAQTLTNKTLTLPVIASISNSGTITLPTGTDTLVGRATTDTLTNKTLTAPKFANNGFIADTLGLGILEFGTAASAVNRLKITNSSAGQPTLISTTGTDTNISINVVPKGTGKVYLNNVESADISSVQTFTNKTWNGVTIGLAYGGTGGTNAATARTNLDVPSRTGLNASGTWDISITGAAATALNGDYFGITNTNTTTGKGLSLYGAYSGSGAPSYGIMLGGTPTFGTHGAVTATDHATYFLCIDGGSGTRGWVFKNTTSGTGGNVASISNLGVVTAPTFVGNLTGNASSASAVSWSGVSGKPTTLSGYGITDAQALSASLTSIAALAGTSGTLIKTGASTWALDTTLYVSSDSSTGAATLPVGTTAQRPANATGLLRFNSTLGKFEGNTGTVWGPLGGGATGAGTDEIFYLNGQTVNTSYTIESNKNAMSAGPITIANGATVTIPNGSVWTVV